MSLTQIPAYTSLTDDQFIQIQGPNELTTGYQYDEQTRALYFKESQILYPSFHGSSHIAEDLVPSATCDTPGLMSSNDKCKLDALLQTRVGVLGFMGAGFPDDGGWLQGDIILAAGSEFISLERVGNVVRITADNPIPFSCSCESCQQIFWVMDETDTSSIRPPTCSGKLPGVTSYGELKIYLMPEAVIADPNNVSATLNQKGAYPALIFKRYDDAIAPGTAEFEMVLKRDENNQAVTEVGWACTPGPLNGVPECVWFAGKDGDGNQNRFDFTPHTDSGMLGAVLYKGNLISKQMGVITGYTSTILSTNQYTCRYWNADLGRALETEFTAKNVWQYANPENPSSGVNPRTLIFDQAIDLLPVGTLVDLWYYQVGEVAGQPILRYYFSKRPPLNPNNLWAWGGGVQFGDSVVARDEVQAGPASADKVSAVQVSSIRDFERSQWGLTGFNDPLLSYDVALTAGTDSADISTQHRAVIDTSIPALKVVASDDAPTNFSERPVWLWNRRGYTNAIIRMDIGRPSSSNFSPFDVMLRSMIDEHDNKYMKVVQVGVLNGLHYVRVKGVHVHDLPSFGSLRVLSPSDNQNIIFNYTRKFAFPPDISASDDSIILACDATTNSAYLGDNGDILELLHQEYTGPCVRVEFTFDPVTGLVQLQFKVGVLDMSLPYENDISDDTDDYVRGLADGYAVSAVYSQAGTFTGVGTQPNASPSGFVCYDGGAQSGGTQDEFWNRLEIMHRDDQIWIWWNRLLIIPSTTLSAGLDSPVSISTPYFSITSDVDIPYGKVGVRMWPGALFRRCDVRSQLTAFNEYQFGQLIVS